ncbi:unnamed protein product [Mytilus edulis]|uniref:Uncharacterized protein n=1 Tax=Mytilus edulis TaxID=6550 RepID=A0A8S3QLZ0_MYTED|nr:unnamed protein product [Mytilus edulis]
MARFSREKKGESLNFYNYLCQKIGSEEVMKIRRLESTIGDIGDGRKITSGSKGEGLNFRSSDLDIMCIDDFFKVYQSHEEVVGDIRTTHLIMNTEDSPPCYTQLCIPNHQRVKETMWIKTHLGYMFSSEQYKLSVLSLIPRIFPAGTMQIHGPYDKIYTDSLPSEVSLTSIQKHELYLMKKEKLYTVLKALSINPVHFHPNSYLIPVELQMTGTHVIHVYYPSAFGHFLNFLCNYHLQDTSSCRNSLQQLESITRSITLESYDLMCLPIFCGIAYQLMGKPDVARQMFQFIAQHDRYNLSGAVSRLSNFI